MTTPADVTVENITEHLRHYRQSIPEYVTLRSTESTVSQAAKDVFEKSPDKKKLLSNLQTISEHLPLQISTETKHDLEQLGANAFDRKAPEEFKNFLDLLHDHYSYSEVHRNGISGAEEEAEEKEEKEEKDYLSILHGNEAVEKHYKTAKDQLSNELASSLTNTFNDHCKLTPELERYNAIMVKSNPYGHAERIGNIANNLFDDAITCLIHLQLAQKSTEATIERRDHTEGTGQQYSVIVKVKEIKPTPDLTENGFGEIRGSVADEATYFKRGVVYNGKVAFEVSVERERL